MLDFSVLAATPVEMEPFRYFVATNVLDRQALAEVRNDFPEIRGPGIFALADLTYGPAFAALIDEIRGAEFEAVMAEKFDVDLSDKPQMITVRGFCQEKDGRIHTDTESKVVTLLLYLNEGWEPDGGRLRFLRGPDDLDDMIAEVPPLGGTMIAFRRSNNSFHGHKPYVGARRYIMVNWLATEAAARREIARHRFSAKIKQALPFR
jgi:hypothetical protein